MKFSYVMALLLTLGFSKNIAAQDLDDYRWKNRLLLLVDATRDTDALKSQLNELTSNKEALRERDLLIFLLTPNAVYTSDGNPSKLKAKTIYGSFDIPSGFAGTLLIGKDGGAKLKEAFEVSAQEIFDLIDSMPMRRREMRQ